MKIDASTLGFGKKMMNVMVQVGQKLKEGKYYDAGVLVAGTWSVGVMVYAINKMMRKMLPRAEARKALKDVERGRKGTPYNPSKHRPTPSTIKEMRRIQRENKKSKRHLEF